MILKQRDANERAIEALDGRACATADPVRRAALSGAASRLRADTTSADACALIDEHFASSREWAVLHDLRLSVGRYAVRLNHLLVSDHLECVCVDTRYARGGLEMDPSGRWSAFGRYGARTVASPLAKAARDARMLSNLLGEGELLPRRFGVRPRASVRALVLTNPALRIGVTPGDARDAVGVYPSDALFPLLWEQRRRRARNPFERASPETLQTVCARILALHRPTVPAALLDAA